MPPELQSSPAPGSERARRIREVIREVLETLQGGGAFDLTEITRRHVDLMPELEVQLHTLRRLESAVRAAAASGTEGGAPPPLRGEDVEVLRAELTGYEILERVRYGGQGVVYKARQQLTGRIVAIKVLIDGPLASDRQRWRFEREIELTSRLRHPNIVTLFEAGVVRNRPYFAMEFVEGNPIDDHVILYDLTPREVVRIMIPVCRAVHYAHLNGVIHRDLNPSNILVDAGGQPHVMDFGLAKDVWERVEPGVSLSGQVIGTLPFLSPEQAHGLGSGADVRTDVYALGITLFHAICADFPYPVDGEPARVRRNIIEHPPRSLRRTALVLEPDRREYQTQINADLDAIVLKALAKEPDERYQSAAELAADLERYLSGDAVEARRHARSYRIRKALRRYRVPLAVSALLLSVALVSGVAVTLAFFRARAERDIARQATRITHQTLDLVVHRIDSQIAPLAGGSAVRNALLDLVDEKLAQLRALVAADEQLADVLTGLLEREGDLALARGAYGPAAGRYREMLKLLEARSQSDPQAGDLLRVAARGYAKLVRCTEEPERDFPRAIAAAKRFAESSGYTAEAVQVQAWTLVEIGRRHLLWGHHEDADRHFAQAIELLSGLSRSGWEADQQVLALLATAHEFHGTTRQRLGDLAGWGRALENCVELRTRLVAAAPVNVEFRHSLMRSLGQRASYLLELQTPSEAFPLLAQAIEHGEYLVRAEPTVTGYRRDLALAHIQRSILYCESLGRFDQALLEAEAALAHAEELERLAPLSPDWFRVAPAAGRARARVLLLLDCAQAAKQDLLLARDALAAAPGPEQADIDVQSELAATLSVLADLCGFEGSWSESVLHARQALEHYCELYERDSGNAWRAVNLVRAAVNLAGAHCRAGTPDDLRRAVELLEYASGLLMDFRTRPEFAPFRSQFEQLAGSVSQKLGRLRCPAPR
jgi:serine/threonine protein kinase